MSDLESFADHLKTLAGRRQQFATKDLEAQQETMERQTAEEARFREIAVPLFDRVVKPRLEVLAGNFEDSRVFCDEESLTGGIELNLSRRVEAQVQLSISLRNMAPGELSIVSEPRIIPILMALPQPEELRVPLDAVDEARLAGFVETALMAFAEVFVEMERSRLYRKDHWVMDPVCGMTIDRDVAVAHEERGHRKFAFCTEECHRRFLAEPEKYVRTL